MSDETLTKVLVDLPQHWATGGESFWASPLGNDLYEIRNVPFHAYNLNFLDVVRAVASDPTLKPEVLEVVRRSGHTTLRVFFTDESTLDERVVRLRSLSDLHVEFENANDSLFALDVLPEGDVNVVRDHLDAWEKAGVLEYETCEAQEPGGFDSGPGED